MPSTQAKASSRSAKQVEALIHLKAHDALRLMHGTVWMARSRWSRCDRCAHQAVSASAL